MFSLKSLSWLSSTQPRPLPAGGRQWVLLHACSQGMVLEHTADCQLLFPGLQSWGQVQRRICDHLQRPWEAGNKPRFLRKTSQSTMKTGNKIKISWPSILMPPHISGAISDTISNLSGAHSLHFWKGANISCLQKVLCSCLDEAVYAVDDRH